MFTRIALFLAANLGVLAVLSLSMRLLGVDEYLASQGGMFQLNGLLIMALAPDSRLRSGLQAVQEELVEIAGGVLEAAFSFSRRPENGAHLDVEIRVVLGRRPD